MTRVKWEKMIHRIPNGNWVGSCIPAVDACVFTLGVYAQLNDDESI